MKKHLYQIAQHSTGSNWLSDDLIFEELNVLGLVDYLEASHRYFFDEAIPKIEQSFMLLLSYHQNDNSLSTLFNLFLKFEIELKSHVQIEEQKYFPYARTLYCSSRKNLTSALMLHFSRYSAKDFALSHEHTECYLTEIITLLANQKYMDGHPVFNILLKQLKCLDEEIRTHGWVEDHILVSKLTEIEEAFEAFVTNC